MLLHQIVKANREAFDRYIFYRGLGYSVKASELLGCVTYGSEHLLFGMRSITEKTACPSSTNGLRSRENSLNRR